MAQVEVLVLALAEAAEAAVRRLFPLGLLRDHYHLYPPPLSPRSRRGRRGALPPFRVHCSSLGVRVPQPRGEV